MTFVPIPLFDMISSLPPSLAARLCGFADAYGRQYAINRYHSPYDLMRWIIGPVRCAEAACYYSRHSRTSGHIT